MAVGPGRRTVSGELVPLGTWRKTHIVRIARARAHTHANTHFEKFILYSSFFFLQNDF